MTDSRLAIDRLMAEIERRDYTPYFSEVIQRVAEECARIIRSLHAAPSHRMNAETIETAAVLCEREFRLEKKS